MNHFIFAAGRFVPAAVVNSHGFEFWRRFGLVSVFQCNWRVDFSFAVEVEGRMIFCSHFGDLAECLDRLAAFCQGA